MSREESSEKPHPLWRREGVLYWINPMMEELYSAREVKPLYFDSEVQRDAAFLILQSSLYYTYWLTYSNLHHHNWAHIRGFPFPKDEDLETVSNEIHEYAEELWKGMKDTFTQSREVRGDFHMRSLKPLVDEIDDLLAEFYNLSDEELEYVQNYITDLGENSGRRAPEDANLSEFD